MNAPSAKQFRQPDESFRHEQVEPKQYPNCFGCGARNSIGLRLRYHHADDTLVTKFTPKDVHQGWPGIMHGGIIATLLYEVMENFAYHNGDTTMMRSMETHFHRPARIGECITAIARFDRRVGREIRVTAALTQDKLIAEGTAQLVALTPERIERLGIT